MILLSDVLSDLEGLRGACSVHWKSLSDEFALKTNAAPISGFAMCFNQALLSFEALNLFNDEWNRRPSRNPDEHEERGKRIVEQTKGMFVASLSALEFVSKQTAAQHPQVLQLTEGRRHYLSGIMGKSHAVGLIDEVAHRRWEGIGRIRNTVIHNNAFGDEDLDVDFGRDLIIALRVGAPMSGSIRNFVRMMRWAVDGYADWSGAFLKRANGQN